jgi:hypothetical protein
MRRAVATVVLALAASLAVSTAWTQGFGSGAPDRFFRVEADGGQGRGGRPVIRGYVYNDYGQPAGRIQLQVESLDATGQVVGRTLAPVDGTVPPFGRLYFDVPVSTAGARYRATVYYFEWVRTGGGGGASLHRGGRAG